MGVITISVRGSFPQRPTKEFSAMKGGHAQATAEAIQFLSGEFLSNAIQRDHELHDDGEKPEIGFGERV